jgi:crotonobetainyl-CoA:carnitine CoA-transferase CaiB-like acyl-CoA transferase
MTSEFVARDKQMTGVLSGIRVLDVGRYIAGSYCAARLAEHGVEVIRIEKREGSEDRFQAPVTARYSCR